MATLKRCGFASIILLTTFLSHAQVRKYANEFLNIGVGSRGISMGGAQVASVNDATAGYWNPAGLALVKGNAHVMAMHNRYFDGIGSFNYLGIAIPSKSKKNIVMGVNVIRFAIDDIPNTLFLFDSDGKPNFNNITSFSSADYAALFSIAKSKEIRNGAALRYGGSAKIIHRKIGSFASAWGFGVDLGVQYQKNRFTFAAAAKDITTTYTSWSFNFTEREKEQLFLTSNKIPVKSSEITAPRLVLGAAYKLPINKTSSLTAEVNADLTFDGKRNVVLASNAINADPKIGVEYNLKDILKIRAGVYNFQQAYVNGDPTNKETKWIFQPGAGIGFKLNEVYIDYALSNLANQDNALISHVFTLRLDLVKKIKAKK
jgi:hypothetical protein